jgi:dihydroflavonol-4-reductase
MILITGATGFLGAELVRQLTDQGSQVRALRRENSRIPDILEKNSRVEWCTADINDFSSLEDVFEDVTQVYHCAAFVSLDAKDKFKLIKVNIEGTSNVVNLCAAYQARLLHVSSVAALGEPKKGMQITEDDYWEYSAQAHAYAISKYEGEMEVWRGIAEGLDAVIVNPSVIIGAGAGFEGSGAIFKMIRDGLSYYTRGATGFVDVADVATSMTRLMNSSVSGERFIISSENYHYQGLFQEIAAGFGQKPPSREAQPWMLGLAWRGAKVWSLLTGKRAALTGDMARSSMNESFYSNTKIKTHTAIEFKPINQSIREICMALKNR